MTIRQTGAHGDFVNTLVQVVALDDVVGLLEYSVAISVAMVLVGGGAFQASNVLRPIVTNLGVLGIGSLFGLLMKWMMKHRSTDNRLIISIACLFTFCGAWCPAGRFTPAGLHVHGHGVYQSHRRR